MPDYTGVDPQVVRILETIAHVDPPKYQDIGRERARAQSAAVAAQRVERHGLEPVKSVEDRVIAGPGGQLPIRVYRAQDAGGPDGGLPVVLFVHGGGWTIGSVDTYDALARVTCNRTGAVLVSVDYRLAPEHPYPAALDDAWAALRWTSEHAAELGGDPARLGLWGDSAGGNICAALTLRARDAGGPAIKAQCLVYASVDTSKSYPSAQEFAEGFVLTAATSRWFSDNYLPEFSMRLEPGASPLLADSHAGLPPAVIAVGSHDILRDQNGAYAEKLRADGVHVWHRVYPGLVHTFSELGPYVDAAREARDEICVEFRTLLLAE
jgi:acetyl esterase